MCLIVVFFPSWSIVALPRCVVFCCITEGISITCTYVPFLLDLPATPPPPSHPSKSPQRTQLVLFFTTLLLLILLRYIKCLEFRHTIWGLDHSLKYFLCLLVTRVCVAMTGAVVTISKQVF